MTADGIARFKITLDDVKPQVLRRLEVPLTIRLDRLHLALQAAIGWTNSHLYELRAGDVGWGIPDPDTRDGPLDARKARRGEATPLPRFETRSQSFQETSMHHALVLAWQSRTGLRIRRRTFMGSPHRSRAPSTDNRTLSGHRSHQTTRRVPC